MISNKPILREIHGVARKLKAEYNDFSHHNRFNPLDELIFIICSIKRRKNRHLEAFRALKRKFPSYRKLSMASESDISIVLAPYGLQNEKASAIKKSMQKIIQCFGKLTLNPLRQMSDAECEEFLTNLKGVGKKVARCVMMYSLGRRVFPVDSNCWRVCLRLGWINGAHKTKTISPDDMDLLQLVIPPELRFSLHVNMISHGREVCTVEKPNCHQCIIRSYCFHAAC